MDGIEVSWAVVGGLALAARGEPRPTRDIDVAIAAVDDREAERCVRALVSRGYRIFLVLERKQSGELATVRLFVPGKGRSPVIADLLFRSCGIEEVVVAGATRVPLEGQRDVPVVSRAALVAMKLLSESDDRPRDRQDLVDLLRRSDAGDLAEVDRLIGAIAERGASRGRDLSGSFARFLEISRRRSLDFVPDSE